MKKRRGAEGPVHVALAGQLTNTECVEQACLKSQEQTQVVGSSSGCGSGAFALGVLSLRYELDIRTKCPRCRNMGVAL